MSLLTAWESLKDRTPASYAQFLELAQQAQCFDITVDGQDVGAVLVIGPEIHACVKPQGFGRWMSKRFLRLVDEVIARHGYAQTTVTAGNHTGDAFVRRLGFVRVSDSPHWVYRREKRDGI